MNNEFDLFSLKFENYISLGHCCYVASELNDLGLRNRSYPFDWIRSRWRAVEHSLKTNFNGFLDYDSLYQKKHDLHVYKDLDYGVSFFHDFSKSKSLKSQLSNVQEKYNKRIDRFFYCIKTPTLFFRYCWDYDELKYISDNYIEVESLIKSFCNQNEIVFLSHDLPDDLDVSSIKYLFFIEKSKEGSTNENPISSCNELYNYLKTVHYPKRQENLEYNKEKELHFSAKMNLVQRIKRKINKIQERKTYIHKKQCDL